MLETTIECQKSFLDFGIEVKNLSILEMALTHPTYSYEHGLKDNNQRLEFLGDTVLSLIIVEHLYHTYPEKHEGELSKIKSVVVSGESLAKGARKFKLYDYILIGKGEEKVGGRYRDSVLADAFEAILAAIYIDLGYDKVKVFIFQILDEIIEEIITKGVKDYKTILQELLQKDYKKSVEYKVLAEKGPDHDKVFTVGLLWEEQVIAIGLGKSKKEAERQGAKIAIEYFLNKS